MTVYTTDGRRIFNSSFIDFTPPDFLIQRLRVSFLALESTLRLSSDFHVTPRLTLTPGLGVLGGHQFLKYRYDAYIVDGVGRERFPYREDQSINSFHAGGLASLRLKF